MRIYNGTPHDINVIVGAHFDPAIRKFVGGDLVRTLPSDGMLNAKIDTVATGTVDGIPTFKTSVTGCDPLPTGDYDIFIVSQLYATAYTAAHGADARIYVVSQPVMSDDGKTFRGCVGITRFCD